MEYSGETFMCYTIGFLGIMSKHTSAILIRHYGYN